MTRDMVTAAAFARYMIDRHEKGHDCTEPDFVLHARDEAATIGELWLEAHEQKETGT